MASSFASTVPANISTDVNQLFASLLEFRWRDVSFPVANFRTVLRQDLVIHKFADRDGAHIEGVGRAPLQITARIPFLNGLDAGQNEHWQRPLYPYTWRKFFEACADKSSGTLQHPELGPLTCKLDMAETDWAAEVRSGVWVDAVWIESDDTGIDLNNDLNTPSPAASVAAAAGDLDTQIASINPNVIPQPYVPPTTFTDLVQAVRGTIDQTTLLQKSYAGRLDNLLYEAGTLTDSLDASENRNALNWPMYDAAERIRSAANDLKRTLLTKGKPVGYYTVSKDSTMAQLSAVIPADLTDLMTLNAAYLASPLVPQGAVLRYYKKAAQ